MRASATAAAAGHTIAYTCRTAAWLRRTTPSE